MDTGFESVTVSSVLDTNQTLKYFSRKVANEYPCREMKFPLGFVPHLLHPFIKRYVSIYQSLFTQVTVMESCSLKNGKPLFLH